MGLVSLTEDIIDRINDRSYEQKQSRKKKYIPMKLSSDTKLTSLSRQGISRE